MRRGWSRRSFATQKLSLRLRLAFLVAGTALPLILFAGTVVYLDYLRDRQAAAERVLETVRGMRLLLDRELQSITSALQVLALSRALQRDDLPGFRADVAAFLSQYPGGPNISLADRSGQQIVNMRVPPEAPLPKRANRDALDAVFATGRPAYSNLYVGAVSQQLIVTVNVPVWRDGRVVYDISFTPQLATFQKIIEQQRPSDDWTIAIFDGTGVNFARAPNPETTVGRRASPSLYSEMFKQREATLVTQSLEGVELISAFSRSTLAEWTVAAGLATATITAPLWRTLAITASIGMVLLGVGLAFAVGMATTIARGEALHGLLINELNHRVKNTLATVQAIAAQTFRGAADPEATRKFEDRLIALGQAHNVLSKEKWDSAEIREIVEGVLEAFAVKDSRRLQMSGPPLRLSPRCALIMSMALHELATNAVKYGAWSNERGQVLIDWTTADAGDRSRMRLRWREVDGPPVQEAQRKGFGSKLIEHTFASQIDGSASLEFSPSGVLCILECPRE
jgi:two-component sensor histidine kinase